MKIRMSTVWLVVAFVSLALLIDTRASEGDPWWLTYVGGVAFIIALRCFVENVVKEMRPAPKDPIPLRRTR